MLITGMTLAKQVTTKNTVTYIVSFNYQEHLNKLKRAVLFWKNSPIKLMSNLIHISNIEQYMNSAKCYRMDQVKVKNRCRRNINDILQLPNLGPDQNRTDTDWEILPNLSWTI